MGNLIGGKDDKMSYKFKITRGNAILNFSEEYCQSRCAQRPTFTFDPLFHAGCYYVQEASSMFVEQVLRTYITGPQDLYYQFHQKE